MALDYCHSQGILHLDVKPANIMVNSHKWIKLGDFGNSISIDQLDSFQVIKIWEITVCLVMINLNSVPPKGGHCVILCP